VTKATFVCVVALAGCADPDDCDGDRDGHESRECGGRDCDDADSFAHPGGEDVPEPWSVEPVDETGRHVLLALGPSGAPHVFSEEDETIRHAWQDGAGWHSETAADGFELVSAAISSDGASHLVLRENARVIHYATDEGGAWRTESLFRSEMWGDGAILSTDEPLRIAFAANEPDTGLFFVAIATPSDGGWSVERIAEYPTAWSPWRAHVAAARGPDGDSHLLACIETTILHYTDRDGSWLSHEIRGPMCDVWLRKSVALAVDSGGNVHAVWGAYEGLTYASEPEGWQGETVDGRSSPSLALDAEDMPSIAFTDSDLDSGPILLARRTTGILQVSTAVTNSPSLHGAGASIALGPDGSPLVAVGDPPRLLHPAPPRDGDCDGTVRQPADADGDGWLDGFVREPDCDDSDPSIHPGAEEITGDRIDSDCDGEDD
jgi:hypothetical protein